jgi:hypothetical protein
LRQLDREDREALRTLLLKLALTPSSGLRGVSIDVLIRDHDPRSAETLFRAFDSLSESDSWRHELVFAMIRMGYKPGLDLYLAYIAEAIQARHQRVGPLVAALANVDPDAAIVTAAPYLTTLLKSGDEGRHTVEHAVPTFRSWYMRADPRLLVRLVQAVRTRDRQAGALLGALLQDELRKPWNVKQYGKPLVSQVERDLTEAASSVEGT